MTLALGSLEVWENQTKNNVINIKFSIFLVNFQIVMLKIISNDNQKSISIFGASLVEILPIFWYYFRHWNIVSKLCWSVLRSFNSTQSTLYGDRRLVERKCVAVGKSSFPIGIFDYAESGETFKECPFFVCVNEMHRINSLYWRHSMHFRLILSISTEGISSAKCRMPLHQLSIFDERFYPHSIYSFRLQNFVKKKISKIIWKIVLK